MADLGVAIRPWPTLPWSPSRFKVTVIKLRCPDPTSASRLGHDLGRHLKEKPVLSGDRRIWAALERDPKVGERKRLVRDMMDYLKKEWPMDDWQLDPGPSHICIGNVPVFGWNRTTATIEKFKEIVDWPHLRELNLVDVISKIQKENSRWL